MLALRVSAGGVVISVRAAATACFGLVTKVLVGIAIVASLLEARAVAADLTDRPPPAPRPNWSGPYLGVGLDARYNAVDANVTSATVGNTPIPLPPVSEPESSPLAWWGAGPGAMAYIDNIAIGLRIYGGWNFQVAPAYVIGVEGDFAYANETAALHGSPYPANLLFGTPSLPFGASPKDEFKVTTTWDASARLRAGWLPNPSLMVYVTAGLAWAHLQARSACSTAPTANVSNCAPGNYFGGTLGPDVIEHSATKLGWTAGAGAEMLLGSNWVARVQYRFADFGYPSFGPFTPFSFSDTRICTGCAAGSSPLSISYELPVMQHHFEIGVSYRFGP